MGESSDSARKKLRKGERERERDEVIYLENYRIRKKIREERRER